MCIYVYATYWIHLMLFLCTTFRDDHLELVMYQRDEFTFFHQPLIAYV